MMALRQASGAREGSVYNFERRARRDELSRVLQRIRERRDRGLLLGANSLQELPSLIRCLDQDGHRWAGTFKFRYEVGGLRRFGVSELSQGSVKARAWGDIHVRKLKSSEEGARLRSVQQVAFHAPNNTRLSVGVKP